MRAGAGAPEWGPDSGRDRFGSSCGVGRTGTGQGGTGPAASTDQGLSFWMCFWAAVVFFFILSSFCFLISSVSGRSFRFFRFSPFVLRPFIVIHSLFPIDCNPIASSKSFAAFSVVIYIPFRVSIQVTHCRLRADIEVYIDTS